MRVLMLAGSLVFVGCGAGNSCPKATVGSVSVTINGVKDPIGAGECATGTSSDLTITLGGTQNLIMALGVSDKTGALTCGTDFIRASLTGTSDAFKPNLLYSATEFSAGGDPGSQRPDTNCTMDWSGIPPSGKAVGTFTGRLAKADHNDGSGNPVFLYADVTFGFSFEP